MITTGHTANISDSTTVTDFALQCSRSFGVLISLKDKPIDASIPTIIKPSEYYLTKLGDVKKRLHELENMDEATQKMQAKKEYENTIKRYKKSISDITSYVDSCLKLLKKVVAWVPPTKDHSKLKTFMIEQLETVFKNNKSNITYNTQRLTKMIAEGCLSGASWKEKTIQECKRDLIYYKKESDEDFERAAYSTKWLQDLRESTRGMD